MNSSNAFHHSINCLRLLVSLLQLGWQRQRCIHIFRAIVLLFSVSPIIIPISGLRHLKTFDCITVCSQFFHRSFRQHWYRCTLVASSKQAYSLFLAAKITASRDENYLWRASRRVTGCLHLLQPSFHDFWSRRNLFILTPNYFYQYAYAEHCFDLRILSSSDFWLRHTLLYPFALVFPPDIVHTFTSIAFPFLAAVTEAIIAGLYLSTAFPYTAWYPTFFPTLYYSSQLQVLFLAFLSVFSQPLIAPPSVCSALSGSCHRLSSPVTLAYFYTNT